MKVKLPCMFNTQPLNGKRHQIVTFFLPENNGVVNNKSRLSVNIDSQWIIWEPPCGEDMCCVYMRGGVDKKAH